MVIRMKRPKMIMFDYGQTLIFEERFDGLKGMKAVLKHARSNPYQVSAREVQEFSKTLDREIGRFDPDVRKSHHVEVHNHLFQNYLYQYFGLEIDLTPGEIERVFWDNAAQKKPTEHIQELLAFLRSEGIRSGVISNISFSGMALEERLRELLPEHEFEFILATSEFVFRKPHPRIFELALRKAHLDAREVWYCGDNAYFDVEGAFRAGIYPIWYRGAIDSENKISPDSTCLTINDWMELINYLSDDSI